MITLISGLLYSYGSNGERICIGARTGRRNELPPEGFDGPVKLSLVRLAWHDGDYDYQGCYFGGGLGDWVYYASGYVQLDSGERSDPIRIFVRAVTRDEAKTKIQEVVPDVRFYR